MLSYIAQLPPEVVGAQVFSMLKVADLVKLDSAAAQRSHRSDFEAALKATPVKVSYDDKLAVWRWCAKRCVTITEFAFQDNVDDSALLSDVVHNLRTDATVKWLCNLTRPTPPSTNTAVEASGVLTRITEFRLSGYAPSPYIPNLCSKMTSLQQMHVMNGSCVDAVLFCPPVQALVLRFMSLQGVDGDRLLLRHAVTLNTLGLLHVEIGIDALRAVSQLTNLRTLFLLPALIDAGGLDVATVQSLLIAIARACTKLERIHISGLAARWPVYVLETALSAFASHCAQLREITLTPSVSLGDEMLIRLAENCHLLHKLTTVCWEVTSMDAVTAAQALWARLRVLDVVNAAEAVMSPALCGKVLATLICALSRLECIEKLELSSLALHSELLDESSARAALPLTWNQGHSTVADQCFTRMAAQSGARLRLRTFYITKPRIWKSGCQVGITYATIVALAQHCPNLEWVDLSTCTDATEDAIMHLVERCRHLWRLEIPANFSPEAKQRVVEGLTRNRARSAHWG